MIKALIKYFFFILGYRLERLKNGERDYDKTFGRDENLDLQVLLRGKNEPKIFDIGAHNGQSIDRFRALFPDSEIYSFEPDEISFLGLRENYLRKGGLYISTGHG